MNMTDTSNNISTSYTIINKPTPFIGFVNLIKLFRRGYDFMPSIRNRHSDTDIIRTMIAAKTIYVLGGEQGARLFYNNDLFERQNVLPSHIVNTIFGAGIHIKDNSEHQRRKQLFINMDMKNRERLVNILYDTFRKYVQWWQEKDKFSIYTECQILLAEVGCKYIGLSENQLYDINMRELSQRLIEMVDAFGAHIPFSFPKNSVYRGKRARKAVHAWLLSFIKSYKKGEQDIFPKDTPGNILCSTSFLTDDDVAVELINLIRPIAAVSKFIAFSVLLGFRNSHTVPTCPNVINYDSLEKWTDGDNFVDEVRRLMPFVPFLGALTRKQFSIGRHTIREKSIFLLDIYGTNHDENIYDDPYEFKPSRYVIDQRNDYNYIPQGGGKVAETHRCPGEWITNVILKMTCCFILSNKSSIFILYPRQDLSINMKRIPTMVKDGVILQTMVKNSI
jgi:fatty-acid peroxygenase